MINIGFPSLISAVTIIFVEKGIQ